MFDVETVKTKIKVCKTYCFKNKKRKNKRIY